MGTLKKNSMKMSNTSQVVIITGGKGYHATGKGCLKGAAIVPFLKLGHGHMGSYSLYYIVATGHSSVFKDTFCSFEKIIWVTDYITNSTESVSFVSAVPQNSHRQSIPIITILS